MLWGQTIKVYTDHTDLTQEALGLTSNRVYCWQLLLEELAPEIVFIKEIYNMLQVPFLDWTTIPRSTRARVTNTTMLRLVCQQKERFLPDGRLPQNHGVLTMNTLLECKCKNAI